MAGHASHHLMMLVMSRCCWQSISQLPVIVGKDRYAAGMLAIERFGVDTIVLDDGFQHVQLARDLNILLLDTRRPFGNGRLFPRGNLRDRPAAIARADAIVLTRWESNSAALSLVPNLANLISLCSAASIHL